MSEQKKNSESRNIRLSDEVWDRVILYADQNGMSRGAVVESAILKFLDGVLSEFSGFNGVAQLFVFQAI